MPSVSGRLGFNQMAWEVRRARFGLVYFRSTGKEVGMTGHQRYLLPMPKQHLLDDLHLQHTIISATSFRENVEGGQDVDISFFADGRTIALIQEMVIKLGVARNPFDNTVSMDQWDIPRYPGYLFHSIFPKDFLLFPRF